MLLLTYLLTYGPPLIRPLIQDYKSLKLIMTSSCVGHDAA